MVQRAVTLCCCTLGACPACWPAATNDGTRPQCCRTRTWALVSPRLRPAVQQLQARVQEDLPLDLPCPVQSRVPETASKRVKDTRTSW